MVRVTEAEAKKRLGELIRDVAEGEEAVLIEKDGATQAVVISFDEYTRLKKIPATARDWKKRVDEVRRKVAEELGGRPLTPVEEVIRRMRKERDEQILGSLR